MGIRVKNPELENSEPNVPGKRETTRTSKYVGVSWGKREKKWLARFTYRGKPHFVGYFTDELEAAAAINERCRYLNIPIKNQDVKITATNRTIIKFSEKFSSIYYHPSSKMWIAEIE